MGAGNERLDPAEDFVVFLGRDVDPGQPDDDRASGIGSFSPR